MYVDDETSQDNTGAEHDSDQITVTVEGEEYELEAEHDVNKDGDEETAVVQTDDGGTVAFSDTDGDGKADLAVERGEDGRVEGAARYDESTGEWVAVDPNTGEDAGSGSGSGSGSTTADDSDGGAGAPAGHVQVEVNGQTADVGQATEDFDGDGKNDTVIVKGADGSEVAYIDEDEDGDADVAIIAEQDGDTAIVEETSDESGEWEVVETGHVGSDGTYERTSGGRDR